MPLSWNEIKSWSTTFSKEWKYETSEDVEVKSLWDGIFHLFTVNHLVATLILKVRQAFDKTGFNDLVWKCVVLVKHKSRGKYLNKVFQQTNDYFIWLKGKELPRDILVSDFASFRLYDSREKQEHQFWLSELVNPVNLSGIVSSYHKRILNKIKTTASEIGEK
jgi:hypothetical protein